jgi:subtilase family serine protease
LYEFSIQGQSYFDASGDHGAFTSDPGGDLDQPFTTLVGGTVLSMNGKGASWKSETAWPFSGGGILTQVQIPDYQKTYLNFNQNKELSMTNRNAPDVSLVASDILIYADNGQQIPMSGTSFSAPLWAGYMALVNQLAQPGNGTVGFANPLLYQIGLSANYNTDFHDINDGSTNPSDSDPTKFFTAVNGFDLATGWGTPTAALINDLSNNPNKLLDSIRFVFSTGNDNLRGNGGILMPGCGGTGLTADVLLQNGTSFPITLKGTSTDEEFPQNTTTAAKDFKIPSGVILTQSHGIKGITLTIHEGYSSPCTADNWDVNIIDVSLFNSPSPPNPQICQLHLFDNAVLQDGNTGLIRFSEHPDTSGSGPTATFLITDHRNHCQ